MKNEVKLLIVLLVAGMLAAGAAYGVGYLQGRSVEQERAQRAVDAANLREAAAAAQVALIDSVHAEKVAAVLGQVDSITRRADSVQAQLDSAMIPVAAAEDALARATTLGDSLDRALQVIQVQKSEKAVLLQRLDTEKQSVGKLKSLLTDALSSDSTHIAEAGRERARRMVAEAAADPHQSGSKRCKLVIGLINCPSPGVAFLAGVTTTSLMVATVAVATR